MTETSGTGLSGTRERILEAARDLFEQRGFHRTSVQQIADRLGLVKTAVLYHFPTKADLLTALVEPLLDDWEAAVVRASQAERSRTRWAMIEGMLDACLEHRHVLRMLLHDLAMLSYEPVYQRFVGLMTQQQLLVAGPRPSLAGRIRASQAIAMVGDPVVLFADQPTATLRREVLAGVRLLLGDEPVGGGRSGASARGPAGSRGRSRGRPPALSPEQVRSARALYASGRHSVDQIAERLGVSRATLYRYFADET